MIDYGIIVAIVLPIVIPIGILILFLYGCTDDIHEEVKNIKAASEKAKEEWLEKKWLKN